MYLELTKLCNYTATAICKCSVLSFDVTGIYIYLVPFGLRCLAEIFTFTMTAHLLVCASKRIKCHVKLNGFCRKYLSISVIIKCIQISIPIIRNRCYDKKVLLLPDLI